MGYSISEPDPASTAIPKGAAAVGQLCEVDEAMQVFVLYMRRWTVDTSRRQGVWNDATERFGAAKARQVIAALDIYLTIVATHATRPIQCHGTACTCLGEDEATLLEIVCNAGRQNGPLLRMLVCKLIAAGGFAETVGAAAQLFEALCHPSLGPATVGGTIRDDKTLH